MCSAMSKTPHLGDREKERRVVLSLVTKVPSCPALLVAEQVQHAGQALALVP